MRPLFKIAEQTINAQRQQRGDRALLLYGEKSLPFTLVPLNDNRYRLKIDGQPEIVATAVSDEERLYIHLNGQHFVIEQESETGSAGGGSSASGATGVSKAPMPGTVVAINVESGQQVSENETLMVIESMKMETTISAARDGVVAKIHVGVGDNFDRMAILIELEE